MDKYQSFKTFKKAVVRNIRSAMRAKVAIRSFRINDEDTLNLQAVVTTNDVGDTLMSLIVREGIHKLPKLFGYDVFWFSGSGESVIFTEGKDVPLRVEREDTL